MSKIDLDTITSGYNLSKINSNFQKVEDELNNKVLYRNSPVGEPNNMSSNLDMNGQSILNAGKISSNSLEIGGVQVVPDDLVVDPYNGVREALRRSYGESGYNMVPGSFEAGGTLVNSNDVLLHELSGKAYTGPAGIVLPGTSPIGGGFVDRSTDFGSPVNIEWFGASISKVDNLFEITSAITFCKSNGRALYIPGRGGLSYKFSGTLYPSGLLIVGDGEMDSRLEYTGAGIALGGDNYADGSVTDQSLFDFVLRDVSLIGPGKLVSGSVGVDGNVYRNNWTGYTITNFETGVQARGAIAQIGMGRIAGCKWGLVVRPYKSCLPSTTITISASVDNCEDGIWVDHIYNASPIWPQTSGFGGAAAIVFRDTVVEKCSGVAYKVNRAATVIFDNAYQEQNGKAYDIVSSTNPIFITPLNGFGSAAGTISYTGLAEVDQGYTANELFGTTLHHLYVGGPNAKGGATNPYINTASGRGIRSYLSGGAAFIKDSSATTQDAFWIGNTATPKKYVFTIDDSTNHWLRLNSYTDAGAFSQTGFVFDQINGRWSFGTGAINTNFRASFNGPIGPVSDNISSLGVAAFRWSVVYAGTGAINTSDARAKTSPQAITDDVLDVADSIEITLFQWLDAIREKGEDEARWHFGPIAQQIRDAFEAKGLDGRRYGLLCYDKWEDEWEPVIEEVVENIIVNSEGGEEVVKTSRFIDTGKKHLKTAAGDRWGVRPDQCHWLLLAAARRRATRIEERLRSIESRISLAGM